METKIQCDICSKTFKTDKTLSTHKNKFHKEVVSKVDEKVDEEKNIYMKYLEMDDDNSSDSDCP